MAEAIYRIIRNESGYVVEVVRLGALPQLATGFASEVEAENWIAQDKRLWEAADPFRIQTGGRWRGF